MANFEIVVRPVIFPNIRPTPQRTVVLEDEPDKNIAEITGTGSNQVTLTDSWSFSASYSKPSETHRRVDDVRVYQEEDDGTINKENFVDISVANKIWMNEGKEGEKEYFYQRAEEQPNTEIRIKDRIVEPPGGG
jgi:hypothetical protein